MKREDCSLALEVVDLRKYKHLMTFMEVQKLFASITPHCVVFYWLCNEVITSPCYMTLLMLSLLSLTVLV